MFLFKNWNIGKHEFTQGLEYHGQEKYAEAESLLRQSAEQREKVLGADHVSTLNSKFWLALTLQQLEKYAEAEQLLRQQVEQREKVRGVEHVDTLRCKYLVVATLYGQQKYAEAEQLLRQLIEQLEKVRGAEHVDTLDSRYWLASTLRKQQKYAEAEQLSRQVVQQQEKTLGADHVDTLDSKHWLAVTLQKQQKYAEAEQLSRQLVEQREKVLGADHADTLRSKYRLAVTLHEQQKYAEAEQLLRQVVQQREKTLGVDHVDTLDSKHWLAVTLHEQQKYDEAEQLSRQLVEQREKVLGTDHVDTLRGKHQLAVTLHEQQKYDEAESLLRQSAEHREKVLGADHKDTLASKELLQKVTTTKAPAALTNTLADTLADTVLRRLSDFFADGDQRQTAYTDSEIQQVALLLSHVNLQWSKVPRTYMVLRSIDCLELLDTFIDLGFSDHWFPVTERSLPLCLQHSKRSQFVAAQDLVMTKSMNLEKGEEGQHCFFREHEPLPLKMKGKLGSGGFGKVYRVLSFISSREYALKQVPRSTAFGGRGTECDKLFIAEIEILKRIKHRHVVEFVGSYTDPNYMGLIMSPVADMDLSTYLARADTASHRELRTFFGCLAQALKFLHEQNIRHKDIKPSNILVHGRNVLYTDFGLALDFTDKDGSTTAGRVNDITYRYCAPEVADHEPRNTSSDIWSLGVVFLEMTAVLKGRTVEYVYDFLKEHGLQRLFVRTNPTGTYALITELKGTGSPADNAALVWVQDMVMLQQLLRPTAASLMASITSAGQMGGVNEAFCGKCCASHNDVLSDFDELEIANTK
jgi:TolA-binding protein